jgi:hypothetical protein
MIPQAVFPSAEHRVKGTLKTKYAEEFLFEEPAEKVDGLTIKWPCASMYKGGGWSPECIPTMLWEMQRMAAA